MLVSISKVDKENTLGKCRDYPLEVFIYDNEQRICCHRVSLNNYDLDFDESEKLNRVYRLIEVIVEAEEIRVFSERNGDAEEIVCSIDTRKIVLP
jgi:hypothetical protein